MHDIISRLIIDKNWRFGKYSHSVSDARKIVAIRTIGKVAGSHFPQIHSGFGAEHAVDELFFAHFKRKHAHRCFCAYRRVSRNVQSKRSFSDRWAGRQYDKVGFLQSGKEVIKFAKTGGESSELALFSMEFVETFKRFVKD